jgi:23S rRNA (cytidine1920-2'-O)/16S rRNA (cytidine1409-2'-O)-methyltransferase
MFYWQQNKRGGLMNDRIIPKNQHPRRTDRADALLVERGLVTSRTLARAMILAGQVFTLTVRIEKPGQQIKIGAPLRIAQGPKYVSRGGNKLEGALGSFQLDVAGFTALDVGASTGGFTDCLLQHGAVHVYAVDVGRGQISSKLRQDDRVTVSERINARYDYPLKGLVDLVTFDVSFISLRLVVPTALKHLKEGGLALALVKPQFEVGRKDVGKGGIVRKPEARAAAVGTFVIWVIKNKLRLLGIRQAAIRGETGNQEYFVLFQKP